jgi:hypothetical protein
LAATCLLGASAGADARTRTVVLETATRALDAPVALPFDHKLTLVFPEDVELAVPGGPDLIAVHVRGAVVAVSAIESEYTRARRPTTNLTVVTRGGAAVTMKVQLAGRAIGAGAPDLIRFELGPGPLRARAVAADEAAAVRLARQAASAVEPVDARARARQAFIYLVARGGVHIGDRTVLRFEIRNHSQPPFVIARVRLLAGGAELPAVAAWEADRIPPDGAPRGIGVVVERAALLGVDDARVSVCEADAGRCVEVELGP